MILRRVIEHVKAQNWFAVAIDFIIVVVGVFIGIQVSNWNGAQADRATERLVLERLANDFEEIVAIEEDNLATVDEALRAGTDFLQFISSGASVEDVVAACERVNPARAFRPPPAASPTYVQLVASGEMRLIRAEPLRVALARYDINRDRHSIAFDSALDTSLALSRQFWRAVDICDAARLGGDRKLEGAVRTIFATPDYAGALSGLVTQHGHAARFHRTTLTRARDILVLLEEYDLR